MDTSVHRNGRGQWRKVYAAVWAMAEQSRTLLLSSFVFVEKSKVRCNFIEMSSVYCAGFDLRAELEKGSVTSEPSQIPKRKRRPV